jgi:hypothetical protein
MENDHENRPAVVQRVFEETKETRPRRSSDRLIREKAADLIDVADVASCGYRRAAVRGCGRQGGDVRGGGGEMYKARGEV